jgi:hypothetical protein
MSLVNLSMWRREMLFFYYSRTSISESCSLLYSSWATWDRYCSYRMAS